MNYGITAGDFHKQDWNERRWSQSSCSSVKSYMEREYPHTAHPIHRHSRRHSKLSDYDDSPAIAEVTLPWRRDLSQNLANRFRKLDNFLPSFFLSGIRLTLEIKEFLAKTQTHFRFLKEN